MDTPANRMLRWAPVARLAKATAGIDQRRSIPSFAATSLRRSVGTPEIIPDVWIWADSFTDHFFPDNALAAIRFLESVGVTARVIRDDACCGLTWITTGQLDQARSILTRTVRTLTPYVESGVPVVGLEPSCILTLRDEFRALLPGAGSKSLARTSLLLEEFLTREAEAGRLDLPLRAPAAKVLLHGHCHQKAFGTMGAVERALRLIPDMAIETVDSSCCGMAGAFGYQAETIDVSMAMGELSLLPAIRAATPDTLLVADGTSCRHQIADGTGREALHVAEVLARALDERRRPT